MKKSTLLTCNFDKILSSLSSYTFLEESSKNYYNIDNFDYFLNPSQIDIHYRYIDIFLGLVEKVGEFAHIEDISFIFDKNVNQSLEIEDIVKIRNFIQNTKINRDKLISYVSNISTSSEAVFNIRMWTNQISPHEELLQKINHYIDETGNINNSISPLKEILKNINSVNHTISNYTKSYILDNKDKLNLENLSVKNGRNVFGVKSSFKNQVDGFIVSQSSSKDTVFFESRELIEYNNDIENLKNEYDYEVKKIISTLSALILDELTLKDDYINFKKMDIYYTYSVMIKHQNLKKVELGDINLLNIRPFIKNPIPLDIKFNKNKVVILSGVNSGGKSVALKTLGLAGIMVKAGMYLDVLEGSSMPIFDDIDIIIGDGQNTSNSLSSFTSHIIAINKAIENLENKLILVDEICTSTSPIEGVALACSIIEKITNSSSYAFMSTHYDELKYYALNSKSVINACVNFDINQLKSIYSISYGLPSASYGIDIASKIMAQDIIDKAKDNLSKDYINISNIIKSLNDKELEIDTLKNNLHNDYRKLQTELEENNKENQRLLELKKELDQKELFLKNSISVEYRKELENKFKTSKEITSEIENINSKLKDIENEKTKNTQNPKIGDNVIILKTKVRGSVIDINKDNYIVQAGIIKMSLKNYEMEIDNSAVKVEKPRFSVSKESVKSINLDLRGTNLQDCLDTIDSHINRLIINHIDEFYVIHGIGEGILSKGIHSHLKKLKYVKSYEFAHPNDGGNGKTWIKLK